ncbi:hypothetical protein BV20DRAFT_420756 [Pilatotrama ljubarskyi]|nr:hypothetical protein BV20DRAFT_420756 [Pilatotrama ljubarskyi]
MSPELSTPCLSKTQHLGMPWLLLCLLPPTALSPIVRLTLMLLALRAFGAGLITRGVAPAFGHSSSLTRLALLPFELL